MVEINTWFAAATGLLLVLALCGVAVFRGTRPEDCFVACQMGNAVSVLVLLLIAQGMDRPAFFDLALTLALLSLPAVFLYATFLEKWIP